MFHGESQTFHGGAKSPTESVKWSTEVLTVHEECQMFHRGAKCSEKSVKCSMEVLNILLRVSNDPRRC